MTETYISTDVEIDDPIPGPHSMLSIGAAAYTANKQLLSTFSANLETFARRGWSPRYYGLVANRAGSVGGMSNQSTVTGVGHEGLFGLG